jgi:hypothetical protein
MELKPYDKPYLPAFKGALLILFGITGILQIVGSIKVLNIFFVVLIGAIGVLSIATALLIKNSKFKLWSVISGGINLVFAISLLLYMESSAIILIRVIIFWIAFYVINELIEAGILLYQKNAFGALFVINALLSLLFGYFLYVVTGNFTPNSVFYIGLIALITGSINVLSSYLLSRLK